MRYIISLLTIISSILASYVISNNGEYLNIFYISLTILAIFSFVDAINMRARDIDIEKALLKTYHFYYVTVFDEVKDYEFTCPNAFPAHNANEAARLGQEYYRKISNNNCIVVDIYEIIIEEDLGGDQSNGEV